MQTNSKITNWYALKVFNNRLLQLQETIQRESEGLDVQTYIAMTEVDRPIQQKPGKNNLVSYSGEKLATSIASKRDIIRLSNKEHQVISYKKPLVASLMFIKCTETFLKTLKLNHLSEFSYYTGYKQQGKQLQKVPAIIQEDQMQAFIWYTSKDDYVQYLGDPREIKLGDRVKVTEGQFKGLIGNIKRIKKDRKFVLTIGSIASFTIGGITHKMVVKIEDESNELQSQTTQ